ncbi:hypothetical protein M8C21_007705 [Ambrosia artemisiifolia]|uniref:Uncharacterized protein n=1 Tax=Ambrosia artemisiifolia TaxID=4212 RepID=A0AAD5CRF2_AMBAR|nr:hypothetical protein M8C21_007705 [Ambrosia artemisiifolia]
MTLSPSPSTENQCSDVVTGAANLSKNGDISSEHVEDENEEDEEGDMDFNPFLKEALSLEASSSLSSEIEEFDADVIESRENYSPVVNVANAPDELQDDGARNVEPSIAANTVTDDVTGEGYGDMSHSQKVNDGSDDEDAIWRRTRARYSLVGSTLDELETFLQETDDEDDLHHNIDDEEEYRKFLAAVLNNGDACSDAAQENDNLDEDEDNDADFELELEEALESDVDENLHNVAQEREHERVGRRPETRQKKRQKTNVRQNEFSGHTNRPLRPILPYAPISPNRYNSCMIPITSSANNNHICAFTPHQIGQLHCLMYEHVQLLVQLFSLSILEPSRHHVATQVHKLLSEMLHKRDQLLTSQRVPYPRFCFSLPYICSAVTPQNPAIPMDGSFWLPFVSDNVLSVMDVAPLNLVQSYLDDVSVAVREHQQRQLEATYDGTVDRECLFPFGCFDSSAGVSSDTTVVPDKASDPKSKKTIAASLVERSKNQSIALVPKAIAKLALRFFPLFNPALFPHKPPPSSVANRLIGSRDNDIFVRQKNRACSRAPENPIKAVRRLKTSPLTPQEKVLIEENGITDNGGGENNSGDDGGNNEDEAYVHEAFLADWRPVSSGHDDASLPYYPLNGTAGSSSSFDFFPNNSPQLNLNLFRYSDQAKNTLNFFNNSLKSNELSSPLTGVDFHPLLQRSDDGNGQSSATPIELSTPNPTAINVVPRSPNELDLDIRLSSTARKENGTSARESGTTEMQPSGSHGLAEENGNDPDFGPGSGSVDGRHDEIVMEQEELSDSEDDDVEESVEFECEEMTDSEGEGGSDSDHVENVQNEDVQDDSLPKVTVHEDNSDQDEPRCQETAGSDEPTSLLGLRSNRKLPVTRSSQGSRSSKKTASPHQQLDAATQPKKPRKRAQRLDPRYGLNF